MQIEKVDPNPEVSKLVSFNITEKGKSIIYQSPKLPNQIDNLPLLGENGK